MQLAGNRIQPRSAFSLADLLAWIAILAIAFAILIPSLSRARFQAKGDVCSANLRGLGQSLHIFANDNKQSFPHHYFKATAGTDSGHNTHGINWIGTMGSSESLKITEDTTPTKSATAGHPSRSLFQLIIQGSSTPQQFICPNTTDKEDELRNSSPAAGAAGQSAPKPAQPGLTRFDFQGYDNLSYGYQMPFGPKAQPTASLDVRAAIMADKGPYCESGGPGLAGTQTTRDQRSKLDPPQGWSTLKPDELLAKPADQLRPYNSRSHNGEGQNVLFVDGHAQFCKHPFVGVNNDNIYTIQNSLTDRVGQMIGVMPGKGQTWGPLTDTDSFIVP